MALVVTGSYTTPQGITVPSVYWRWVSLGIDVPAVTATVTLYGFVDAAAYAAGCQPIAQLDVPIRKADFVSLATQLEGGGAGLSDVVYGYCRTRLPQFAAAQVV